MIAIGHKQGFILVTVLILLCIFSLLSNALQQLCILQLKITQNIHQADQMFYLAEAALALGEKSLNRHLTCFLHPKGSNDYAAKSSKWWLSRQTCVYPTYVENLPQHARFIIEKLANYTCIGLLKRHPVSAIYYRITAWAANSLLLSNPTIVQSTYLTLHSAKCKHPLAPIKLAEGRQAWRLLN